ncbi:MAG TPA: fibronectin type III domain-containing protein [Nitrospirota bacterium]|nr:fibronectin type III domain-containing protein [Nitrospirota bacterium]
MSNRHSLPVLPHAPFDLIAVSIDGFHVILAWTECGSGGLGFRIERADGIGSGCRFSEVGGTGPHVAAFHDGSVKPRTAYSYRVHAWNASGDSAPTNVVEVTTPQAKTKPTADRNNLR